MKATFRTEAFIVPVSNRRDKSACNVIDDVKISKIQQLQHTEGNDGVKNDENVMEIVDIDDRAANVDDTPVEIDVIDVKAANIDNEAGNIHNIDAKAAEINSIDFDATEIIKEPCDFNSNICLPTIKIDEVQSANEKEDQKHPKQEQAVPNHRYDDDEHIYDVPFSYLRNKVPKSCKLKLAPTVDESRECSTSALEEPIYDVPYLGDKKPKPMKMRERFEIGEYVSLQMISRQKNKKYFPKPPLRTSSLMSIDERGETPDTCNDDLCCHGYKNGCTAATKRPEEVTEGIFEVNWMKRLEQLRTRETMIKDKETLLFDREKLLFKKEKELRILERLLKDKLKHAELCSKRHNSQSNELIDCEFEKKYLNKSKVQATLQTSKIDSDHVRSLESLESCLKSDKRSIEDINRELITTEILKSCASLSSEISTDEIVMKNPPNSRSSLVTATSSLALQTHASRSESHFTSKHSVPGFSAYSSTRLKRRPKISYDDLDSTLSADVGDSSFVATSKKFDPAVFKRPYAFTRTLSERRPRPETLDCKYEEEKLMKRFSDNIFGSFDGNTKFQNYGMIDVRTSADAGGYFSDKTTACHEDGKKKSCVRSKKEKKLSKERPFSWNEETNEWLQKKREAYNMQTAKRISTNFENKENHGSHLKLSHHGQKKVSKNKKFNIFR